MKSVIVLIAFTNKPWDKVSQSNPELTDLTPLLRLLALVIPCLCVLHSEAVISRYMPTKLSDNYAFKWISRRSNS